MYNIRFGPHIFERRAYDVLAHVSMVCSQYCLVQSAYYVQVRERVCVRVCATYAL